MYCVYAAAQHIGRDALQEIGARAGIQCASHLLVTIESTQHDGAGLWVERPDRMDGGNPVHDRHAQVEQ
jgi:hypothetical protein